MNEYVKLNFWRELIEIFSKISMPSYEFMPLFV